MLPRFLKTFLLASLLLIVPTLFILYQKRSGGTEWNEWSLTYGTWDSWDVNQKPSSDIEGRHDSALYFEDHWNAGGAAPDYQSTRIVDADREEEPNGAWVYRIGETVISIDELEAYRQWKESRRNEAPFSKEEMPSSADAWQDDSVVLGNVIMPKLGNATAKYVIFSIAVRHLMSPCLSEPSWDEQLGSCFTWSLSNTPRCVDLPLHFSC